MNALPKVSIITCLYNPNLKMFKMMLGARDKQNYPKKNIEHIVMDGGSERECVSLAKRYQCDVETHPELRDHSLIRMSLGIKKAKGDILLFLEPDNIMVGNNWLEKMVEPFINEPKITGAFSMYNSSKKNMPALTRYTALLGVNDPVVYYLNKSEKMPVFIKRYSLGQRIKENKEYTIVKFTKNNLPTLGDNGHMVRREIMNLVNKDPQTFIHPDAFANLLSKGYNTYAVVHNSIIHVTGSNVWSMYKKRALYKSRYYDMFRKSRTYFVFNPKSTIDRVRLSLFVFYSLTFIQPLMISLRGYFSVHDTAWFLHPIVCFLACISYIYSEVRYTIYGRKK